MIQNDGLNKIPYHTAFVVNPTAGEGKAGRIWLKIESLLKQTGQQYRAYITRTAGDGAGLAARAVEDGAELIVAVGGDGTLREVVNGLDLQKNVFGIIPAGTGNGFIRSCSIPLNWRKALEGLSLWSPRRIDLGLANDRYFLNMVGLGLDAAVAEKAGTMHRYLKGYSAYAAAIIDQVCTFKRFCCKAWCNDLFIQDNQTLLAVVANGPYYGGILKIAPHACIDDGQLELCLIRNRSIPELVSLGARILIRQHIDSRAIIKLSGHDIKLQALQRVLMHIDGDVFDASSVEITLKPGALRLLAPP